MKYVMITNWEELWDKKEPKTTYYPKNMFRSGMSEKLLKPNTKTIFIKINRETKKPERAWEGIVTDFSIEEEKIEFKYRLEKELTSIPKEWEGKIEGWYVEVIPESFSPPFFHELQETQEPNLFEDYVYFLLKLIGINDIYKYEKQAGHADGFFKIRNLAVLYDCTLKEDYPKEKEQQVNNFCNQLEEGKIKISEKFTIPIRDCTKEVWIITKGESKIITRIGEITVKEVSINSLFQIYWWRLTEISPETYGEEQLEEKLRDIGNR